MLEKITSDVATMQAIGHKTCQVAGGTSCKTCHAENLISFGIRWPPESAVRNEITASAPRPNPQNIITAVPQMRNARGIRSQIVAAPSANALHMLIEY